MKFDAEIITRGESSTMTFECIDATNKGMAEIKARDMLHRCEPKAIIQRVKVTPSSVRLEREAQMKKKDLAFANGPELWRHV